MITVAILINGQPLVAKNAINQSEQREDGATKYLNDAGEVIWHHRDAGAVALAITLLKTIRNDPQAGDSQLISDLKATLADCLPIVSEAFWDHHSAGVLPGAGYNNKAQHLAGKKWGWRDSKTFEKWLKTAKSLIEGEK